MGLILFLLVLIAGAGLSHAQQAHVSGNGTVTVRVTDEARLPVAGARVSLHSSAADAGIPLGTTREDGTLRVTPAIGGSLIITVETGGFFAARADVDAPPAGEELDLEVVLQAKRMVEESIVVTATGTPSMASESPVRTDLVNAALVDAQAKTTLADALQATIAGVRTEMNCQNCGFVQLRIHGLDGPYTQILEDGLPTYSGVAAVYGLEQIPAAFVEQIEVVKGGNSALYGPNAVAGVVNLIRREPVENRFRLDTMAGWHRGRPEQQLGLAAQLIGLPAGLSADVYYRGVHRTQVDRDGDGFTELGRRQLQSGGATVYRSFFEGNARMAANYTGMDEYRRGGDLLDLKPHQTNITELAETRRQTASLRWTHTLDAYTYYSVKAAFADLTRDTYYGSAFDPNAYGSTTNPLTVADAQIGRQQGAHNLLGGYQVWHETVEDLAPAYGRKLGGTFRNQGVYLQDEWRVGRRLTVIGGARADWANTVDRTILSPRAGFRLGLGQGFTWRATVSTGFRAPGVFDEDLHIAQVNGEGLLIQNARGLREERSTSFSGGLDYGANWGGRTLRMGVSWFTTALDGVFTLEEQDTAGGFRQLFRINAGSARVAGLEWSAETRLHSRVGMSAGFTWQTARYGTPEPQFGSRDFFRTPGRFGFVTMDTTLPGDLSLVATTDFTGTMRVPHYAGYIAQDRVETSRSFQVLNLTLSRTFRLGDRRSARFFVNAQNVGDRFQPDLDRGKNRDSAYVYGPVEMRRIVVGTSWEF